LGPLRRDAERFKVDIAAGLFRGTFVDPTADDASLADAMADRIRGAIDMAWDADDGLRIPAPQKAL
jgi:hypothetical protein